MECVLNYMMIAILLRVAIFDLKEKRIPNILLLSYGIVCVIQTIVEPRVSALQSIVGAFSIGVFLVIIYLISKGSIGMGDVKLMTISGILLGMHSWDALFVGIFLAGAYCLIGLACHKLTRTSVIAFGPFLCIGIVYVMLGGNMIVV